jgi:copper homeostasis protein
MTIEIACNNLTAAMNAWQGGANRIELFENLSEGGTTPSFGLIKKVKEKIPLPIYVMIRPRGGHFVYDEDEFEIMRSDINTCRVLGVDGIVFGALTKEGNVDVEFCRKLLVESWKNKPATFHRAFDRSIDLNKAMEDIISLGFERVLTSGGYKTVDEGMDVLKSLQEKYGSQIKIMPGSGVTAQNAKSIIEYCGVDEIHSTCKANYKEEHLIYNPAFSDTYPVSDLELIKELVNNINN